MSRINIGRKPPPTHILMSARGRAVRVSLDDVAEFCNVTTLSTRVAALDGRSGRATVSYVLGRPAALVAPENP
jgi:hypothetical protein